MNSLQLMTANAVRGYFEESIKKVLKEYGLIVEYTMNVDSDGDTSTYYQTKLTNGVFQTKNVPGSGGYAYIEIYKGKSTETENRIANISSGLSNWNIEADYKEVFSGNASTYEFEYHIQGEEDQITVKMTSGGGKSIISTYTFTLVP